jgi:hypothetical protein
MPVSQAIRSGWKGKFGSFLSAGAVGLWLSQASSFAQAEEQPRSECAASFIHVSDQLDAIWRDTALEAEAQSSELNREGACSRFELTPRGAEVFVEIRLADGRTAARRVDGPGALQSTVEALLINLPGLQVSAEPAPAKKEAPPQSAAPSQPDVPSSPRTKARSVTLGVGVGASSRLAGVPFFVGYGLSAYLEADLDGWLIGTWTRWDFQDRPVAHKVPHEFVMASFLLGAYAGRRFDLSKVSLDVIAGPNLIVESEESAGPGIDDVGGEMGALSLGGALRLLVPSRGSPGFFCLLGGELVPQRMTRPVRADPLLPVLPRWSVTLAVGAAWSAL